MRLLLVLHEKSLHDGPIVFKGYVNHLPDLDDVYELPSGRKCKIEGLQETHGQHGSEMHCFITYIPGVERKL